VGLGRHQRQSTPQLLSCDSITTAIWQMVDK
jgi:hypothetical protein